MTDQGSIKIVCGLSGLNLDSLCHMNSQFRQFVAYQGSIKTVCGLSGLN